MYDGATRQAALDLVAAGWSKRAIATELGVSRAAILDWTSTRVPVLRIAACLDYPEIAYEVLLRIARVRRSAPLFVPVSTSARLTYVQSYWMHWTCLLPQHGPGPKHRRPIRLAAWQQRLVDEHPWQLIRGLLHSDGCRTVNTVRKGGRQYSYPRWFFSNKSTDILALFGRTLNSVGVEWRHTAGTRSRSPDADRSRWSTSTSDPRPDRPKT
jgi:hypothetical protein